MEQGIYRAHVIFMVTGFLFTRIDSSRTPQTAPTDEKHGRALCHCLSQTLNISCS